MGIRQRKNQLIMALKGKALGGALDEQQVAAFELLYRRAKTEADQDQVTATLTAVMHGWKSSSDAYSTLRQVSAGIGFLSDEDDDEEEDSPAMKAALARSQITFLK